METTTIKVPPLIRSARLVATECSAMRIDNLTGAIVHSKKVERTLAELGIDPLWTEQDERRVVRP